MTFKPTIPITFASFVYFTLFATLAVIVITSFFITDAFATLTCFDPKTECIEAGGTRNIDGVSVTLDCWKYRITYECREDSDNNCEQLRKQGCSQIWAKCKIMLNGTCVVQDETYRCPVNKCEEIEVINYGKDIFCVGGNCAPTNPMKNNNFNKAAANLSALAAAAKEVQEQNTKNPQIFTGRSMECSKNIAGAKNCCGINSSGWAEGVFLNCDDEEKELAKKKEAGLAIDIGEYCHNRVFGVCTSYHNVYCTFGSRIARIVQNDGRRNQLGIGFGDVGGDDAHPNCRGITPEELSHMNFNNMNFSELYEEITKNAKAKIPTEETLKQKSSGITYEGLKEKGLKGKVISNDTGIELKAAERIKEFYVERIKK